MPILLLLFTTTFLGCGGGAAVPTASCTHCDTSLTQSQCDTMGARASCKTSTLYNHSNTVCGGSGAVTGCDFTDCNTSPTCI